MRQDSFKPALVDPATWGIAMRAKKKTAKNKKKRREVNHDCGRVLGYIRKADHARQPSNGPTGELRIVEDRRRGGRKPMRQLVLSP